MVRGFSLRHAISRGESTLTHPPPTAALDGHENETTSGSIPDTTTASIGSEIANEFEIVDICEHMVPVAPLVLVAHPKCCGKYDARTQAPRAPDWRCPSLVMSPCRTKCMPPAALAVPAGRDTRLVQRTNRGKAGHPLWGQSLSLALPSIIKIRRGFVGISRQLL